MVLANMSSIKNIDQRIQLMKNNSRAEVWNKKYSDDIKRTVKRAMEEERTEEDRKEKERVDAIVEEWRNMPQLILSERRDETIDILTLINSIRQSDKYIKTIYTNGGCFQFYLVLQSIFGGCEPCINKDQNHVIARYKGKFYDITGEVTEGEYNSMTIEQLRMCEKWSFSKSRALVTGRCQHCDEPVIV